MEQLFGAISDALSGLGPNAEVDEAVVFAAWKRCAGQMVAERTIPQEFFECRLVIAVEDNIWRRHLEELAPQMIARMNAFLGDGKVRFIEFRIQPRSFTARASLTAMGLDSNAPVVPPSVADAAKNITDPSLRTSFLETAAEYLSRQKVDL